MRFVPLTLLAIVTGAAITWGWDRQAALNHTRTNQVGDASIGRERFVSEGCVVCHAVRGVGGKVAPPLDWDGPEPVDQMDLAAGMWRGAPMMVELQTALFGYQITIQSDDMRHIAAFLSDEEAMNGFTRSDVPDLLQHMLFDEALPSREMSLRYADEEWPFGDDPVQ